MKKNAFLKYIYRYCLPNEIHNFHHLLHSKNSTIFALFFSNWSNVLVYLEMHRRVEQKNQTQSNHWEKKRFFIRERAERES